MKNYITEFIGTFFLVLVIGLTGNPFAIGAILMVMVYMGGHISGAHYNPAISLALFLRKKIELKEMFIYMIFQIAGSFSAALCYFIIHKQTFAPVPNPKFSNTEFLIVEVLFTFALAMVVLNVATSKKTAGNSFYGLAIGFTVLAGAFAGGPISGGAFNPAVGIGPVLMDTIKGGESISTLWIYIVGPFLGGILGSYTYQYVDAESMK